MKFVLEEKNNWISLYFIIQGIFFFFCFLFEKKKKKTQVNKHLNTNKQTHLDFQFKKDHLHCFGMARIQQGKNMSQGNYFFLINCHQI